MHIFARNCELLSKNFRDRLNSANTWIKQIRGKKNLQEDRVRSSCPRRFATSVFVWRVFLSSSTPTVIRCRSWGDQIGRRSNRGLRASALSAKKRSLRLEKKP